MCGFISVLKILQKTVSEIANASNVGLHYSELQIRRDFEDNSKIIFLISQRKHML